MCPAYPLALTQGLLDMDTCDSLDPEWKKQVKLTKGWIECYSLVCPLWHFTPTNEDFQSLRHVCVQNPSLPEQAGEENHMILNDSTASDWRPIKCPWHHCWQGLFPNSECAATQHLPPPSTHTHTTPKSQAHILLCLHFGATAAAVPRLNSETSSQHTSRCHLNISWRRCAETDRAEQRCPTLFTLFTAVSWGSAHLCWQRTRWMTVIRLFLPSLWAVVHCCDINPPFSWSFIWWRASDWPLTKPLSCAQH